MTRDELLANWDRLKLVADDGRSKPCREFAPFALPIDDGTAARQDAIWADTGGEMATAAAWIMKTDQNNVCWIEQRDGTWERYGKFVFDKSAQKKEPRGAYALRVNEVKRLPASDADVLQEFRRIFRLSLADVAPTGLRPATWEAIENGADLSQKRGVPKRIEVIRTLLEHLQKIPEQERAAWVDKPVRALRGKSPREVVTAGPLGMAGLIRHLVLSGRGE